MLFANNIILITIIPFFYFKKRRNIKKDIIKKFQKTSDELKNDFIKEKEIFESSRNNFEELYSQLLVLKEEKQMQNEKWDDVRPVVIYFAGERFIVEYDSNNSFSAPAVAMVHAYLGNTSLEQSNN